MIASAEYPLEAMAAIPGKMARSVVDLDLTFGRRERHAVRHSAEAPADGHNSGSLRFQGLEQRSPEQRDAVAPDAVATLQTVVTPTVVGGPCLSPDDGSANRAKRPGHFIRFIFISCFVSYILIECH